MFKRWIIVLTLLAIGLIPAAAQDATQEPTAEVIIGREAQWVENTVESAEIVEQDGAAAVHITGTLHNTCEPIDRTEVHRVGNAVFVDLYRTLNPGIRCLAADTPFEIVVPAPELLELDAEATLPMYLVVNDIYYAINRAQMDANGASDAVPPMMLAPMKRFDLPVDDAAISSDTGMYVVNVKGHFPGGCTDPAVARVRPDATDETHFFLDVFQLTPPDVNCPLATVSTPFELTIPTDLSDTLALHITSGDKDIAAMPDFEIGTSEPQSGDQGGTFNSPHVIDSIEIIVRESNPPQYVAHVTGYQSDGCEYPVEVKQTHDGNTINIEIYRVMPLAVACPMNIVEYSADIVLDGTFAPGSYTFDVNGTTETLDVK